MVTKGYQKGVYERVTRAIRGETRTQNSIRVSLRSLRQRLRRWLIGIVSKQAKLRPPVNWRKERKCRCY
jgi:hypothetical protein